eukprot:scaffold2645_cov139-Amphora_coffeaeformis.AAC.2
MVPSNQAVEKALPVRYFVGRHIHHHHHQQQLRCESTTNQPPPTTTTVGPGHETTPSASGVSTNIQITTTPDRDQSTRVQSSVEQSDHIYMALMNMGHGSFCPKGAQTA